jgi:hypothetical protein
MPGRLPWFVTPPTRFLCDPTHRIRVIASYFFKLCKKFSETGVQTTDCERLKENMGYAHKQFRDVPTLEEYKKHWDAALWHMGNEHKFCDVSWCPYGYLPGGKLPERNDHALDQGEKKFQSLKKVFYTYNTPHYLEQMHHPYDSQTNESLHQAVTKVAPKTTTFSTTFSLSDRIALVVIINSVGYEVGIQRIMQKLYGAAPFAFPTVTQIWMNKADRRSKTDKARQEKPETKAKRAAKKKKKIRDGIKAEREAEKSGYMYASGCAIAKPGEDDEKNDDEKAAVAPKKTRKRAAKPAAEKQTKKPKQAIEKTKKKRGTKRKAIAEPVTGGEAPTTSATRETSFPTAAAGASGGNVSKAGTVPAPASVQST